MSVEYTCCFTDLYDQIASGKKCRCFDPVPKMGKRSECSTQDAECSAGNVFVYDGHAGNFSKRIVRDHEFEAPGAGLGVTEGVSVSHVWTCVWGIGTAVSFRRAPG